jgi:signal transduction histidine kinase
MMQLPRLSASKPPWLRLPRRTARLRFAALYSGLFLLSGVALVAVTYVLFERATEYSRPHLPQIPHTPAINGLTHTPKGLSTLLAPGLPQLLYDQDRLTATQHQLAKTLEPLKHAPSSMLAMPRIAHDQRQLAHDQRQLTKAVRQLAAAVHEVARAGSVQAAQRSADSHQLLIDSGIALAIVAVLAMLVGWLLAGRMLRPIRTITRTARRISSASLGERLALEGPHDELKELGDTLDELFDRLQASFEAQRQFVANASHELRTPLARQRALIQVALADPRASVASLRSAHERALASERHLEQMIDGLLALTRGQAALERRERADLADLASQALLAREPELASRDLELRSALAEAPTAGDPRLLERLIANLIDNAVRHNTRGGHVHVTSGTREGHAVLTIANSGQSVPRGEIERLFRPFQRLDGTRTGHAEGLGLGLSIVQAIAAAHGAQLSARANPQGGLTIELAFPPEGGTGPRPSLPAGASKRRRRRAAASGNDAPLKA